MSRGARNPTGRPPKVGLKLTEAEAAGIKKLRAQLSATLDDLGLNVRGLATILLEASQATRAQIVRRDGKTETVEVPDHRTRVKAVELVAKLRSLNPPTEVEKRVESHQAVSIVQLPMKQPAPAPPPEPIRGVLLPRHNEEDEQ